LIDIIFHSLREINLGGFIFSSVGEADGRLTHLEIREKVVPARVTVSR
jgi:hypothetical protein